MARTAYKRDSFTLTKLILCEGPTDEAFIRALARHRGHHECCVRHVAEGNADEAGGRDRIFDFLIGIPIWPGFGDITDILIVVDSDDDPAASFANVQAHIGRALLTVPGQYPVPQTMSLKELGSPSVTVLLIPWEDVVGNLEALIYPAAREGAGANAACVDAFAACAGVDNWTKDTSKTEMKLRSLLALNEDNPFIGLGRVWSEQLIPISHPTFQQVGDAIDLFLT